MITWRPKPGEDSVINTGFCVEQQAGGGQITEHILPLGKSLFPLKLKDDETEQTKCKRAFVRFIQRGNTPRWMTSLLCTSHTLTHQCLDLMQ